MFCGTAWFLSVPLCTVLFCCCVEGMVLVSLNCGQTMFCGKTGSFPFQLWTNMFCRRTGSFQFQLWTKHVLWADWFLSVPALGSAKVCPHGIFPTRCRGMLVSSWNWTCSQQHMAASGRSKKTVIVMLHHFKTEVTKSQVHLIQRQKQQSVSLPIHNNTCIGRPAY